MQSRSSTLRLVGGAVGTPVANEGGVLNQDFSVYDQKHGVIAVVRPEIEQREVLRARFISGDVQSNIFLFWIFT